MESNRLKKHFIYWILPSLFTLGCILFYFYNFFGASNIIAAEFNREMGILEHAQSLLILIIIFLAIKAARNKENKFERKVFILITIGAIFMFLEEIDYGLHYYDLIFRDNSNGVYIPDYYTEIRNVHNNKDLTDIIKLIGNILIISFFVVLPLLNKYKIVKNPFLQYLSPSIYIITTLACLLLLHELAFYLFGQDFHTNRTLDGNISEFEEVMIYYAVMMYVKEMADSNKKLPPLKDRKIQQDVNRTN